LKIDNTKNLGLDMKSTNQNEIIAHKNLIAFCGLYCGSCRISNYQVVVIAKLAEITKDT